MVIAEQARLENESARRHAFSCGVIDYWAGRPMDSPPYDKESLRAAYCVGFRTAAARSKAAKEAEEQQ